MPDLRELLAQGLGNALPSLGAAAIHQALPGREQPGFAQGFTDEQSRLRELSQRQEEQRERRRQQNEDFVRRLMVENKDLFVGLDQPTQDRLLNPLAEVYAEQGNIPQEQATEDLRRMFTAPQPMSPGVALQGANLAASIKDEDLLNQFLGVLGPEYQAGVSLDQVDPGTALEYARLGSIFTPESIEEFRQSVDRGNPNISLLQFNAPEGGGSLPDITNVLATQAVQKLGAGETPSIEEQAALLSKLGQSDPRISPTSSLNAIMSSLSTAMLIEQSRNPEGFSVEGALGQIENEIPKVLDAMENMGIYSPSGQQIGDMLQQKLQFKARILSPDVGTRTEAFAEIRQQVRQQFSRGDKKPTKQEVDAEVTRRVQAILNN